MATDWLQRPKRKPFRTEADVSQITTRKRRARTALFATCQPQPSYLRFDWSGGPRVVFGGPVGAGPAGPIASLPGSPYAAGQTVVVQGQLVDELGVGVSSAQLTSLTLTIVDTLTGVVVNNVLQVNILNTGRGTVDALGNLTIRLLPGDTSMINEPGATQLQRSLVIDWQFAQGQVTSSGRQQCNFTLYALAGT